MEAIIDLTWCVVLLGLLAGEWRRAGAGSGGACDGGSALPSAAAPPCPNSRSTCSGEIGRFLPFAALRWFVLLRRLVAPADDIQNRLVCVCASKYLHTHSSCLYSHMGQTEHTKHCIDKSIRYYFTFRRQL